MSNYIECPNGGKCGHRKHHIRSESYRQCLSMANGHGNLAQPGVASAVPPAASAWDKSKVLDALLMAIATTMNRPSSSSPMT